ncbi:MAG: histidinol-phosphatase [Candidatus Zixiibacteriota bacterium]
MKMFNEGFALADYHVHPNFSVDAEGSIEDFCSAAREKGISEICFTTHFDTNPTSSEWGRSIRVNGELKINSVENFGHYVRAIEKANIDSPMVIKCGVEVGFYAGCEEEIQELFNTYPVEYRLGAVHEVGNIDICTEELIKRASSEIPLEKLADDYFDLVRRMVETGLFDSVAHIDMYKWYGLKYYGNDILTMHRGRIEKVFEAMVRNNTGMEINTAALRKGHVEYYPSMEIVNMARKAGVRIAAIGSDAHRPHEVGYDFEAAKMVAYDLFPYCNE